MGLITELIFKLNNKLDKSIHYNEKEDTNIQLQQLEKLLTTVVEEDKEKVEKELNKLKIGVCGEEKVTYELNNLYDIPALFLSNIRIELEDKVAQIDFIIITRSCLIIIEAKRLIGNITIDNEGNFSRTHTYNGYTKKEGFYSPISQNNKHIDILKQKLIQDRIINKHFPIYSLVVISNPKSIVDKKFAPKSIKDLIVKYDNLNVKIHSIVKDNLDFKLTDNKMHSIAKYLKENNKQIEYDYIKKLDLHIKDRSEEEIYEDLKHLRYEIAKQLKMLSKQGFIFTNDTLKSISQIKPKTLEDLSKVEGMTKNKIDKYGEEILSIVKK